MKECGLEVTQMLRKTMCNYQKVGNNELIL